MLNDDVSVTVTKMKIVSEWKVGQDYEGNGCVCLQTIHLPVYSIRFTENKQGYVSVLRTDNPAENPNGRRSNTSLYF